MPATRVQVTDANDTVVGGTAANPSVTRQLRDAAATVQASGSVTAPAAAAVIATLTIATTGLYEITSYYFLSGTVAAGDVNNVQLRQNAALRLSPLPLPAVANVFPQPVVTVLNCTAADTVSINAVANATASAVYSVVLVARQVG